MNTNVLGAACALSLALIVPANAQEAERVPQPDEPYAAAANASDASTEPASAPADDEGDADETLRIQVLLDRANFSPGEIDGAMGSNTRRAIAGFQRYHGLPDTGEMDAATRKALDDVAGPVLLTYTLTADDVDGPFSDIPSDMEAKAELDALGYESAEEALGEKFHASPALLRKLNPGKSFEAGTTIRVPNVNTGKLPAADQVIVDDSDKVLMLADEDGRVFAQFPTTTGSEHDPLPIGEWKVNGVARDPTFNYNPDLFWDADPSHSKATIPPGPNNPVGVVWIDLSKEHYGIHGTPVPSTIGKTQSHGCIRLTNWSARLVASSVSPGTPVLLRE